MTQESTLFNKPAKNLLTTKAPAQSGQNQDRHKIALVQPVRDRELHKQLMEYVKQEFDYYIPVSLGMDVWQIGITVTEESSNIVQLQDPTQIHLYDEAELHIITGQDVGNALENVIEDSCTEIGNEIVWENQEELKQFLEEVSHD